MISTEKPGTPEELVHFGVKGMKWGVHRTQGTHDFKAAHPTAKARKDAILTARKSSDKTRAAYKKEKRGTDERKKLKDVHLSNPDRATSLRLTRGEKVVTGLLSVTPGLNILTGAAQIVTVAAVGKRRAVED